MIRRLLGVAAVAGLLSVFCFGRSTWSYVKTSAGDVTSAVAGAVPVDFEIRRARTMLADLAPEVRENMLLIAREEAALSRLGEQIADHEGTLEKEKTDILRLTHDLESGKTVFRYANREFTIENVRTDLSRRFSRHRTSAETLEKLKAQEVARRHGLQAARDKMNGLLAARRQLEVEVEQLDARRMMVDAAQTTSRLALDDGALSRTKQLVAELSARLDVEERLVANDVAPVDEIPLDADEGDVVEQITKYFGGSTPADAKETKVAAKR
jgi:hypothetical protein